MSDAPYGERRAPSLRFLPPDPAVEATRAPVIVQGEVPSPLNPPPGCVFHPRCPIAVPDCARDVPVLRSVAPRHEVACPRV